MLPHGNQKLLQQDSDNPLWGSPNQVHHTMLTLHMRRRPDTGFKLLQEAMHMRFLCSEFVRTMSP